MKLQKAWLTKIMPVCGMMGVLPVTLERSSEEDILFHINPRKIKAFKSNSKATSIKDFSQQSRMILN